MKGASMDSHELETKLMQYCQEANLEDISCVDIVETFKVLESHKDLVFQRLCSQFDVKTTAEKERLATLSDEWKQFIEGLDAARKESELAKARKAVAIRNWETTRSILSSKNTERRFTN